ncbi:MAG: flagellar basal-body rod protein FlgG [Alphaproteobacteria bacterium]|jgi:flagellar basal-body rod protein FlgG|nr:flagellar basal-body rod protein FlgG [Alphaproteobacteria bacterium]MDE1987579.1 flagellar basal-body rod protein FlgG [Alphaproteobacteria bacterium]MDE2164345.1 flagellar basal-body rod protein FlgG [Alphaproteobacteria bacterium]MDE2264309.1 flagellar basal-body rod protein FlgG [Alphaproteobacteria bacterium]MDE2499985.1 flagellar basal-body rod protein FlgG [Alphaproteobacteria bacterium]
MRALSIAATGMLAQQTNVEVIANNLANMNTTGYKEQRADFQDLLYQNIEQAGAQSSDTGTVVPSGIQLGAGVRTAGVYRITGQGDLKSTSNPYDIAINGPGYFRIQMPDGTDAYTRAGNFSLSPQGQIVTDQGYVVQPGIAIPTTATAVSINAQGQVQATIPGQTALQTVGQFELTRFPNDSGLKAQGDNLFTETASSGAPQAGVPGSTGYGTLQQGFLETSNVNAVEEITSLITAQRAYEMNSKVVTTADNMLQMTAQLGG